MESVKNYWNVVAAAAEGPYALRDLNVLLNPYASLPRYDNTPVITTYLAEVNREKAGVRQEWKNNIDTHVGQINKAWRTMCCTKQIYKLAPKGGELVIENDVFPRKVVQTLSMLTSVGVVALTQKSSKVRIPFIILPMINLFINWDDIISNCYTCKRSINEIVRASHSIRIHTRPYVSGKYVDMDDW